MFAPLLVLALLGTASVALVWFIGRELFGDRAALAAAAIAAVFPPLFLLNAVPLSEALFIPLELAVIALVLLARRAPAPPLGLVAAAGFACGLAALTRQAGLFLLLAVAVGLLTVRAWPRRRALVATAAAVAVAALTVAPWTIRNASEFDRLIPVALQDGLLLSGTYNALSDSDGVAPGAWRPPTLLDELRPLFFNPRIDEAELNDRLSESGSEYLEENPAYVLRVSVYNGLRLAGVGPGSGPVHAAAYDEMGTEAGLLRGLARVTTILLVVAALAGAALMAVRRRGPLFVWLAPAVLLATTVPIIGSPRYRTVLDPFLILLAVALLSQPIRRMPRSQV